MVLLFTSPPQSDRKTARRIAPPGIKTAVKVLFCLFPVHFLCFFIEGIVGCIILFKRYPTSKILYGFLPPAFIFGHTENHTVSVHCMNLIHSLF